MPPRRETGSSGGSDWMQATLDAILEALNRQNTMMPTPSEPEALIVPPPVAERANASFMEF